MQKFLNIVIAVLLIFNGTGALFGGWNLMKQPDGSTIQLSMHWLENTPFPNYFIPGLVLFICNGIFSVFALIQMGRKSQQRYLYVIAQGVILCGWLLIQILMIRTVYFLHLILGLTGILLIAAGWINIRFARGK